MGKTGNMQSKRKKEGKKTAPMGGKLKRWEK